MHDFAPFAPLAFGVLVLGLFAYRYFRFGSFTGMILGARIAKTVGTVDSQRNWGINVSLGVHVLERELGAPAMIAISETTRGLASRKFAAMKFTPEQARQLAQLLDLAAKG